MMLIHENALALVESLNGNDSGSKSLSISNLDDTGLYTETTEKLKTLDIAARNFEKNRNKTALFQTPRFYTIANMFLGTLRAVFVDQGTCSALVVVEFCTRVCPIRVRQSFQCCQ